MSTILVVSSLILLAIRLTISYNKTYKRCIKFTICLFFCYTLLASMCILLGFVVHAIGNSVRGGVLMVVRFLQYDKGSICVFCVVGCDEV